LALLKQALTLSPGRQDLSLQLAQIYMRQQKFDLARQTLVGLTNSKDKRLHDQAEGLLSSIRRYEEQMTQYRNESTAPNAPRLERRIDANRESAEATPTRSESDVLQDSLRPVEAGEERIQGLFTKLECDPKGVAYFVVQAGEKVLRFRATSLGRVQLTAYVPAPGDLTCGPRKTPENVVITYRPAADQKDMRAKINGEAIALELVPKDFQLKK
jgi:hypothetical protein